MSGEARCQARRPAAAVALVALVMAGCSLFSPYVTFDNLPHKSTATLSEAIDYAEGAKEKYRSAANDQALLSTGAGPLLLPFGAAASGLAISGTSGNPITAITLAGATIFGGAKWLSSSQREAVYLQGAAAIQCAIDAVDPLAGIASEGQKTLRHYIADYGPATSKIEANVAEISTLRAGLQNAVNDAPKALINSELGTAANTALDDAKNLVTTARQNLEVSAASFQNAVLLETKLDSAAPQLITAVGNIQASVDKAVVKTLPELTSLTAALNAVRTDASAFTTAATSNAPKAALGKKGAPLGQKDLRAQILEQQKTLDLQERISTLAAKQQILFDEVQQLHVKTVLVNGLVEPVVARLKSAKALTSCAIDLTGIELGIALNPSDDLHVKASAKADISWKIAVTGGKPPYAPTFVGSPPSKDSLTFDIKAEGSVFIMTVTAKKDLQPAADGKPYSILVGDQAGNKASLKVVVDKADK